MKGSIGFFSGLGVVISGVISPSIWVIKGSFEGFYRVFFGFRGSHQWGYKSLNMSYSYSYLLAYNPTYNYP